jgi:hypothetical protein
MMAGVCPSTDEWKFMIFIHNGVLFNHKEEQNPFIYRKMDGTVRYRVKQYKADTQR